MTVDFYGDEISCVDLATKIILMFGPASDQCLEMLGTHSTDCWYVISLRDFYLTSFYVLSPLALVYCLIAASKRAVSAVTTGKIPYSFLKK